MEIVKAGNNFIDLENGKLIFDNKEIIIIRDDENNTWFKGRDAAKNLEYENSNSAIKRHIDSDDKIIFEDLCPNVSVGHDFNKNLQKHTIFINESGLYSLILNSKMKAAKEFKRWITKEVLPSIRKTGEYKIKKEFEEIVTYKNNEISKLQETLDNMRLENKKYNDNIIEFNKKYNNDVQELKDQNNDLKLQITKTSEEHKNNLKELKDQNKELKEDFKEQKKELKEAIKDLENKLKIKAVINPSKIRKTHKLIILQHKIKLTCFKVLRIQKEREKQEINKYYDKYIIFYNQFEPNPISCFNYLKEHLKRMGYIKVEYNDIELIDLDNYTIEDFKQDLDDLNIVRCI